MPSKKALIADSLSKLESVGKPVQVSLTNELVTLLSDQLYQSPLKAIEELVVNAYDAEATDCRIFVPTPSAGVNLNIILVFDDGIGMDRQGLSDLWQIGRSNKRNEEITLRRKRKQIGKFGIGKLATYTIANRLTYVTKTKDSILSVSIDFDDFSKSATGASEPINLQVRQVTDWNALPNNKAILKLLKLACIEENILLPKQKFSWTLAILEDLKPKVEKLSPSRLNWILSTAMPLGSGFQLYLNCKKIQSSKEAYKKVVEFKLSDINEKRLEELEKSTGEKWSIEKNCLKSGPFPSGITGTVFITERSLLGKSVDIERSHGFFIRVRNRLINEMDELFGLKPLIHGTFNRFRAEVRADDLDQELKSSRETIEESRLKDLFRILLREIFNDANARYDQYNQGLRAKDKSKREGEKSVVAPQLVEHPIADAIVTQISDSLGAEADEDWFYLELTDDMNLQELIHDLYTAPRSKYQYNYTQSGMTERLVKFNPSTSTFWVNEDHELAKEYAEDGQTRIFLENFVTAETLLEVYLRENRVPPHIVGEVLEKRDLLLRSLIRDHPYSLVTIKKLLEDSAADEHELEISLVVAARALGFVAKHISGSGKPDGIARFMDYPGGEKVITLEAKSSKEETSSLQFIGFDGLKSHMKTYHANGCLLVAPAYPGSKKKEESEVSKRAKDNKISCWTVKQLADFMGVAEARKLTAHDVLDIVLESYAPDEVTKAIENKLASPAWDDRSLYKAILDAFSQIEGLLKGSPRTIDMIAVKVAELHDFAGIERDHVKMALEELSSASQGALIVQDQNVFIRVSQEEFDRRVGNLTKNTTKPRRRSNFRD